MKITKAFTIIYKTRTRKEERQLWERYLVELPYMENQVSFQEYKDKLFEMARLKSRTKDEKEAELKIIREKAKKARAKLDKNKDLHLKIKIAEKKKDEEKKKRIEEAKKKKERRK